MNSSFRRFLPALILALIPPHPPAAVFSPSDLSWPLETRGDLSASFGEYRVDHFHGGIDISTGGKTGKRVFSADAGELFRMKVQWRGYGKAVYLRHADGWVTVYAHLDRLENSRLHLEDLLAHRRRQTGDHFPGDIFLSPPLPVTRGQLLGWSGQTGAGGPHLHFELRDPKNRPVDPIRRVPGWQHDADPPVMKLLILEAASPSSFLDGHLRKALIPLRLRDGIYSSDSIPFLEGPFRASLQATDPGASGHKLGLSRLRAGMDDQINFELDLESFDFSENPLAGLVFDLDTSRFSPTMYTYRLFRQERNVLARGTGIIDPAEPGRRTLWFESTDSAGNRSRGQLEVSTGKAPRLAGLEVRRLEHELEISYQLLPGSGEDIAALMGETISLDVEFAVGREGQFQALTMPSRFPPSPFRAPFPHPTPQDSIFLRARLRAGNFHSLWVPSLLKGQGAPPSKHLSPALGPVPGWDWQPIGRGADLRFRLQPALATPPGVRIGSGPVDLDSTWVENGYSVSIANEMISTSPAGVEILIPGHPAGSLLLPLQLFRPDGREPAVWKAFGARLAFPVQALFGPEILALRTETVPDRGNLPVRAGVVRIQPDGLVFRKPVELRMKPIPPLSNGKRLGIFRWSRQRKSWSFLGPIDPDRGEFDRVWIRRGGTYALLEDDSRPEIGRHFPVTGARLEWNWQGKFWASVQDAGKGLDWDGVRFDLDGRKCLSEFDPDRGKAFCQPHDRLTPGKHLLLLQAIDRAGNLSESVRIEFEIASSPR
ncbi:MAG: M23 family metallopeptidase [Acidobacteria bacterium]|nr:M23 family metallopeptidase [Acidobacteriota bacterium]